MTTTREPLPEPVARKQKAPLFASSSFYYFDLFFVPSFFSLLWPSSGFSISINPNTWFTFVHAIFYTSPFPSSSSKSSKSEPSSLARGKRPTDRPTARSRARQSNATANHPFDSQGRLQILLVFRFLLVSLLHCSFRLTGGKMA